MKKTKNTTTVLIAIGLLIILTIIMLKLSGSPQEATAPAPAPTTNSESTDPSDQEVITPSNIGGEDDQTGTPAATKPSTPAEREKRTATPSDAASYSEEDLPPTTD